MTTLTGGEIQRFRLRVLISAVRLEKDGWKRKGRPAKSVVMQEFNLPGSSSHDDVIEFLQNKLKEASNGQ